MAHGEISAEIEVPPGGERRAAAALQRLGFRVLHIGTTVSVSGPAELWTRQTGASFTTVDNGPVTIPAALRDVVVAIHFVEPPEFY